MRRGGILEHFQEKWIPVFRSKMRSTTSRPELRYTMLFKIIAFVAAAIPIILFLRSIFFRRPTRMSEGLKEFKKQSNLAVTIFLILIGVVVAFTLVKLAWTLV